MPKVLVLYSTEEGQTRKVATRVAELLTRHHVEVHLRDASKPGADARLATFDGVVIGASIHYARHAKAVRRLVEEHRHLLNTKCTAFFSVSLSAGGPNVNPEGARHYLDEFFDQTGWRPGLAANFAGAIRHSRYSFVRTLMVRFSLMGTGVPEPGDHEYTDWKAVQAFAETYVKRLADGKREGP
jgi:menaquinone-dependent protoporphyrinogen oxidase